MCRESALREVAGRGLGDKNWICIWLKWILLDIAEVLWIERWLAYEDCISQSCA